MTYDIGSRVIVMERGRLSVGNIIEMTGDDSMPQYTVQFGEFRTVVFDRKNLLRYTSGRWDALNNAMETIFAGYRAEDDAALAKPRTARTRATKAV